MKGQKDRGEGRRKEEFTGVPNFEVDRVGAKVRVGYSTRSDSSIALVVAF